VVLNLPPDLKSVAALPW